MSLYFSGTWCSNTSGGSTTWSSTLTKIMSSMRMTRILRFSALGGFAAGPLGPGSLLAGIPGSRALASGAQDHPGSGPGIGTLAQQYFAVHDDGAVTSGVDDVASAVGREVAHIAGRLG